MKSYLRVNTTYDINSCLKPITFVAVWLHVTFFVVCTNKALFKFVCLKKAITLKKVAPMMVHVCKWYTKPLCPIQINSEVQET